MRTLVDGHNAIHRTRLRNRDHESAREELVLLVRAVDPGAEVYFDARRAPGGLAARERVHGIAVVYVRDREADAAIIERVRDAEAPGALEIVTDDLDLRRSVSQLGARTTAVGDFFGRLEAEPSDPDEKPVSGPETLSAEDFGIPEEIDFDEPPVGF